MDSLKTTRMEVAVVILFFVTLAGVTGIQINNFSVPPLVLNGSADPLILDCDYTLNETEKHGLVVKWFFNQSQTIYQWIPSSGSGRPRGLGILMGKLDLTYRASNDPYKMYRALRILQPTVELTGDYKCHISSFETEASKSASMLVYAPEENMGLKITQNRRQGKVNVSCSATGVYPIPFMTLYQGPNKEHTVEDVKVVYEETSVNRTSYSVFAYKTMDEANVTAFSNVFGCELTIPTANYVQRKTTLYEPGSMALRDSRAGSKRNYDHSALLYSFFSSVLLLLLAPTFSIC